MLNQITDLIIIHYCQIKLTLVKPWFIFDKINQETIAAIKRLLEV